VSSRDVTGGGAFIYINFLFDHLISPYLHNVLDFNILITLSPINQQVISSMPRTAHFIPVASKYFHSSLFSKFVSYLSFLRGKGLRFANVQILCYATKYLGNVDGVRKVKVNSRNAGSKPSRSEPKLQKLHFIFSKKRKFVYESDHNLCQLHIW